MNAESDIRHRILKDTDTVVVCSSCLRACCWHGEFMCDGADMSGTVEKTVAELRAAKNGESEHYWQPGYGT